MFPRRKSGIKYRFILLALGCSYCAFHSDKGKSEIERASLPDSASNTQLATHGVDQTPADRQPKARAACGRAGAGLPEGLENGLLVLVFNPDTRIANFAIQALAFRTAENKRHLTFVRKLDGVAQQIQENLSQVTSIDHDMDRHVGVNFDGEPQAFASCGLCD